MSEEVKTATDALKDDFVNVRLVCGHRWMIWDGEWVVYRQGNRRIIKVVETQSESVAIRALMHD